MRLTDQSNNVVVRCWPFLNGGLPLGTRKRRKQEGGDSILSEHALALVGVTAAAAVSCAPWVGRGNKQQADAAATAAMRRMLADLPIAGRVVIGEGEMDEAPMLYIGEQVGNGSGPECDVAVDPLEGTNPLAFGGRNALCVMALGDKGSFLHAPDMYMDKLAVGPQARGVVDLRYPLTDNIALVAKALGKPISKVVVAILDRPRHADLVAKTRAVGATVKLFSDGDIVTALSTCIEDKGVDLLVGCGGSPEGVLAAAGLSCLGGEMQARLVPKTAEEIRRCQEMGLDLDRILQMGDLIGSGEVVFAATGEVVHSLGERYEAHSGALQLPPGNFWIASELLGHEPWCRQ